MIAFLAAVTLFWEAEPATATALKKAGVSAIAVPASLHPSWKDAQGITAQSANPADYTKLLTPSVKMRANVASATRSPWVDTNGWKLLRERGKPFFYDAPGKSAAIAVAEAFAYGVDALVRTDIEGLEHFARMQQFLSALDSVELPAAANIGVIDDGSAASGEILNLLVRRNLLFRIVQQPDPKLDLNIRLAAYAKEAQDPSGLAQRIRADLGDARRLVRIYGSEVVIARLLAGPSRSRLYLLNYSSRPVEGLRVRVSGRWKSPRIRTFAVTEPNLLDVTNDATSVEFTLPQLPVISIIDLVN